MSSRPDCVRICCRSMLSGFALSNSSSKLEMFDSLLLMESGICFNTECGWFDFLWTYRGVSWGFYMGHIFPNTDLVSHRGSLLDEHQCLFLILDLIYLYKMYCLLKILKSDPLDSRFKTNSTFIHRELKTLLY